MGLVPILSHTFGSSVVVISFLSLISDIRCYSVLNSRKVTPTDSSYTALLGTHTLHRHNYFMRLPVSSIVFSHCILSLFVLACVIAIVFNLMYASFADVLHYTPNQQMRRSLQDTVNISR